MNGLDNAMLALEQALDDARQQQRWARLVRERIGSAYDALVDERAPHEDSWQEARGSHLHRERTRLARRVGALRSTEHISSDGLVPELRRLLVDLEHHRQRVNDLLYDSVAMDLGGSE